MSMYDNLMASISGIFLMGSSGWTVTKVWEPLFWQILFIDPATEDNAYKERSDVVAVFLVSYKPMWYGTLYGFFMLMKQSCGATHQSWVRCGGSYP